MDNTTDSNRIKSNDIKFMLDKLNDMYEKEENIIQESRKLKIEYEQLEQDIELLETLIMHQSNKKHLYFKYKHLFKK